MNELPRYFGFVTGGTLPAALAASWLATAWDNNGGLSIMSPVAGKLEEVALGWLIDLFGFPAGTGGGFVTGATMANFTGLAAARHALLARQGWDVEAQGLFGAPPLTVVVGEEVHVSVLKALSLIGLGRDRVVRVPVDNQGRMRADQLPALDERTILWLEGEEVYVPVTVGAHCGLGVSLVTAADGAQLTAGYGEFAQEAHPLDATYTPQSICLDGWKATQQAWQTLFPLTQVIRCFLHSILARKDRCHGRLRKEVLQPHLAPFSGH